MKWVVFAHSDSKIAPEGVDKDDIIVAADSGLYYALRCGYIPKIVIGDFDSVNFGDIPAHTEKIGLPKEKDDTDTQFAVKEGIRRGFKEICIAGGLGGRLDHQTACLCTLSYIINNGLSGYMSDGLTTVYCLKNNKIELAYDPKCLYISVFARTYAEVTIKNLKYPLEKYPMTIQNPIGASNEFIGKDAYISAEKGEILIIKINKG